MSESITKMISPCSCRVSENITAKKCRPSGHGTAIAIITIMRKEPPKNLQPLSASESHALKKKLRSLRWQPEAVMREIILIRKLREIAPRW